MNNSKKLFGRIMVTAILCISSALLAERITPELRQKIQILETINAKLLTINTSPILTKTAASSDIIQLQFMITKDVQNIKNDLQIIQNALRILIDNELERIKSNV